MVHKEQIIDALQTTLTQITLENGYETDIGQKVLYLEGTLDHNEQNHLVFCGFDESYTPIGNGRGLERVLVVELQANLFAQFSTNAEGEHVLENRARLCDKALRDILRWYRRNPSLGLGHGVVVQVTDSDLYAEGEDKVAIRFVTLQIKFRSDLTI